MSEAELRAAAERVLATITKTTDESIITAGREGGRVSGCVQYTLSPGTRMGLQEPYELAAAWLAERPADDAEPVTQERLRAMPGASGGPLIQWVCRTGGRVTYGPRFVTGGSPLWTYQDNAGGRVELPTPATMGDARRLLRAIGVA